MCSSQACNIIYKNLDSRPNVGLQLKFGSWFTLRSVLFPLVVWTENNNYGPTPLSTSSLFSLYIIYFKERQNTCIVLYVNNSLCQTTDIKKHNVSTFKICLYM